METHLVLQYMLELKSLVETNISTDLMNPPSDRECWLRFARFRRSRETGYGGTVPPVGLRLPEHQTHRHTLTIPCPAPARQRPPLINSNTSKSSTVDHWLLHSDRRLAEDKWRERESSHLCLMRPGYGQSPVFLVAVPCFTDIAAHPISLPAILTIISQHLAATTSLSIIIYCYYLQILTLSLPSTALIFILSLL